MAFIESLVETEATGTIAVAADASGVCEIQRPFESLNASEQIELAPLNAQDGQIQRQAVSAGGTGTRVTAAVHDWLESTRDFAAASRVDSARDFAATRIAPTRRSTDAGRFASATADPAGGTSDAATFDSANRFHTAGGAAVTYGSSAVATGGISVLVSDLLDFAFDQ